MEIKKPTPIAKNGNMYIDIADDYQTHVIIFWYKRDKHDEMRSTDIIVRYKDIDTQEEIPGYPSEIKEMEGGGCTLTKKDIPSYKYIRLEGTTWSKPDKRERMRELRYPEETRRVISTITDSSESIRISNDRYSHEIIFWYKKQENPRVIVKYVVLNKATDDLEKGTNIDAVGPKEFIFEQEGETKTFSKDQIKETGNNYDYVKASIDGRETQDTDIPVTNDGNDHEIIFGYTQILDIKVIGVCTQNGTSKVFAFDEKQSVPVNKTYRASEYTWSGYKLVASGNNVLIKEGTLTWLGEEADKSGGTANVSVTASTYSDQKKMILVVFYYESNYKANVKHIYVNPLTQEETVLETGELSIVPNTNKTISSKKFPNYINLSYAASPDATITPNGFAKYGDEVYNISFVPGEANYTIEFRYTSQIIEVRHEYPDGTPIVQPEIKVLDPNEPEGPIVGKECVYYKLNDGPQQKPTTIKVPVKPGQEKQIIVFVYTTPYLIFGDDDPNPDDPTYPDGKTYKDMVKKYNAGIFPNKMNNQLIGQSDSNYYWVLDEKGELTIRLAYKHMSEGTSTCSASIKIPFDVYINGTLTTANTPISVSITRKSENDDGCEVWEGKLSNIQIPIWTEEKEYTITANVSYMYTSTDGKATHATGEGRAKVTVIGAVYDFSVTNIDGSNTTGDTMWKASLFTSPILKAVANMAIKEYETGVLPIGQVTQQNAKYSYGMKLGTRFYFSVNTKGAKSTSIEITPRFYYFDKAGNIGNSGNPIIVRSGNTDITMLTRTTSLTDANRTTAEYQKELAQGRTTYGANAYSNAKPTVFVNKLITIGTGLRTPFVNYGKDPTSSKYHEVSTMTDVNRVYRSASHWYADYVIPNNATFFDSNNKPLTEGFVLVTFSIKTKAGNDAYLAYNLNSPFTTSKQSEWVYENASEKITLPRTATLTNGKEIGKMIRSEDRTVTNPYAYASIAIYQISPATRTSQNVDSTGTH